MPRAISEDMIRALYSEDGEEIATLVTLTAGEETLYLTDHPGGLTSDGQDYAYAPMQSSGGGASASEPVRQARLEIMAASTAVITAADTVPGNTEVTVAMAECRIDDPDATEVVVEGAEVKSVRVGGGTTGLALAPRDFAGEPACKANNTPSRCPASF